MHNIENEQEFLSLVQEKMDYLEKIRSNYQENPSQENKEELNNVELEYIDFRNYWRRIGEALGLRFGVAVQDMEG